MENEKIEEEAKNEEKKAERDLRMIRRFTSPDVNPFINEMNVSIKTKTVRSRLPIAGTDLINPETGEVVQTSYIHSIVEVDDEKFVKLFTKFINSEYELKPSTMKVFKKILQIYEKTPMSGGYVDSIYLRWMDDGLSPETLGVTYRTFNIAMKELLEKKFLYPKKANVYWVNPSLFFKGDRALMIRDIRRKHKLDVQNQPKQVEQQNEPTDKAAAE